MDRKEELRNKVLDTIANFDPSKRHNYLDEWEEAWSFNACKFLAELANRYTGEDDVFYRYDFNTKTIEKITDPFYIVDNIYTNGFGGIYFTEEEAKEKMAHDIEHTPTIIGKPW